MTEQPSYHIGIRNNLLTAEHRRRLGMRVYEYMWLVDHVTEEYRTPEGEIRGRVHGGAPIKAEDIAATWDVSLDTVRDSLEKLELAGYISRVRVGRGYLVEVRNSCKWPNRFSGPDTSGPSTTGPPRLGESESRRVGESSDCPSPPQSESPTPKDGAMKTDIAVPNESNAAAAAEQTHAGEAERLWGIVASVAARGKADKYRRALSRVTPIEIVDGCLRVAPPANEADRDAVRALAVTLRNALKINGGGTQLLLFAAPDFEARAGP